MKTELCLLLAVLVLQTVSIPYKEQIALVNSLQVGRKEDPMTWGCVGCDESNKPLLSYQIKEDVQEIRAILSVYEEYTVLAFRYTASLKNVWQDLLWAIQVQDQHAPEGCKVQKQYDKMWNSIREQTYDDLIASSHTRRLIITGISLGGGLAMLSYVDINHLNIFDQIEIITFGAPRVGNANWAKWLETQVEPDPIHVCIKGDPVCVMPRCLTPICNYRHSGTGYSCDKKTQVCTPTGKVNFELSDIEDLVSNVIESFAEEQDQEELGSVLDHLDYKKIKEFAWVEPQ